MPKTAHGTGIESPLRWTEQSKEPQVLIPPEFYFELEVKRLAAELHPAVEANMPEAGDNGRDYSEQTDSADLEDFDAAIEAKAIQPPDVEKAKADHSVTRTLLGTIIREDAPREASDSSDRDKPAAPPPTPILEPPAPEEFASEFADYHRGALSYRCGNFAKAGEAWKALLARPPAERKYRTTWALFMLGKAALETKNWDEAKDWFVKTREAASQGFVDSLGLASSSLGWQADACKESGQLAESARLFLDQLASGDTTAILSLRHLLERVFVEEANLDELVRDPVLQRLGTAGAVANMSPFSYFYSDKQPENDLGTRWLTALEKAGIKNVRDADRVAWIAYSRGQYANAERWLQRADPNAPYALWLKAKLTLREGKVDAAAKLLSRALDQLKPTEILESRPLESINDMPPEEAAGGDLAAIRLSRGEFLSAFRTFLDSGHFNDAYYVADAVFTIDELKKFIEQELPGWEKARANKKEEKTAERNEQTSASPKEGQEDTYDSLRIGWDIGVSPPHDELRLILGRRYVRAGRYADARPYLHEQAQESLDQYVAALDRTKQPGASPADRSAAFLEAAEIMREHGESLADFYDPIAIANRLSGRSIDTGEYPVIAIKYSDRETSVPPVSKGEKDRLKKHGVPIIKRYYSLYLASDLAWRAAALLPDNEEKTAELLNRVGGWLKGRDDDAADRFYQAIERRCAKTELGKEAIKRHWFVPTE